ncbi:hypothetical protein DFH27DRAFT_578710 [Peziza echinospora]|nr:hypothetical protein DFH27DRAFT_578710 [Peziza echinospora]
MGKIERLGVGGSAPRADRGSAGWDWLDWDYLQVASRFHRSWHPTSLPAAARCGGVPPWGCRSRGRQALHSSPRQTESPAPPAAVASSPATADRIDHHPARDHITQAFHPASPPRAQQELRARSGSGLGPTSMADRTDEQPRVAGDAAVKATGKGQPPWPIDPEHGMHKGPGFLGDAYHALRVREILKYYKPPEEEDSHYVPPLNTGEDFQVAHPNLSPGLMSSHDPILAAFANLTCRVLDVRRCIVSVTAAGTSYIIAESTRSLSISYPHTHEPGDQLFLGGGAATSSIYGLCEHTCSLLPPDPESNLPYLLEIPDLASHPKYYNAGYVREWPKGRFYCGAPIRTTNGVTIGTICVMDDKPRYRGLTERERNQMYHMADIFMRYLEAKQGEEERNKNRMMEMQLSRFIAEGFLPGEGAMMAEKRDGRLWSPKALERRRRKELERKKKVEERRQMFQEQEYQRMVEREDRAARGARLAITGAQGGQQNGTSALNLWSDDEEEEPVRPEKLVPFVSPSQPGLIQLIPADKVEQCTSLSLLEVATAPPPERKPVIKLEEGLLDSSTDSAPTLSSLPSLRRPSGSYNGSAETKSHSSGSISGTSNEKDTSVTAESDNSNPRLSNYEQTMSMEPQFRAMFARAAELIRNALGADVLFVDGDLEGLFEPESVVSRESDASWSFVSSDPNVESSVRAERPAGQRTNSGILGYSTGKGTSKPGMAEECTMRNYGFDISHLSEEHLKKIAKDNKGGRLFAFVDSYPGLEEAPLKLDFTEQILQKALPGCRSAVVLPLMDHHDKLFSMLFVWSCKSDRTFVSEVEGKFVQGVGESIMGEITRLHILAADKAKAEFISSISHELRSPLHGVLASADFLMDSDLSYDQRSFVDTIVACGATLLDTVNNVLDFQKLESYTEVAPQSNGDGKIPLTPTTEKLVNPFGANSKFDGGNSSSVVDTLVQMTDLSTLVQEVTDGVCLGHEFRGLSAGRSTTSDPSRHVVSVAHVDKVTVILDIEHRAKGFRFQTNQSAIKRIISNLVGNALKYSKDNGWVKVTLSAADLENAKPKNGMKKYTVKLSVLDSGKGMSREFLKTKLFTPFSQENPLSSGAGLGLCIVRRLVELLGGKISIKSRLGEGTEVSVVMNLDGMDAVSPIPEEPGIPTSTKLRALFTGFEVAEENALHKHAIKLLETSVKQTLLDYFGVETVDKETASKDPEGIFIVCNGGSDDTAEVIADVCKISDEFSHAPIVLLCNRSAFNRPAGMKHIEPRIIYVRKPCGPRRLQNALSFCVGLMKSADPNSSVEAPTNILVAAAKSNDSTSMMNFAIGLRETILSPTAEDQIGTSNSGSSGVTITPASRGNNIDSIISAHTEPPLNIPLESPPVQLPFSQMPSIPASSSPPPPPMFKTHAQPNTRAAHAGPIPPHAGPIPPTTAAASILCVEDNFVNLMLLTKFLKKRMFTFETAMNGLQALDHVEARAPGAFDIILMDLQMPVLSGIEATREIRRLEAEFPERKRSFILALTGLAAIRDREEAFAAGVDGFVVKPFKFSDLERILRQRLELALGGASTSANGTSKL